MSKLLKKQIEKIHEVFLYEFPEINLGGCGLFAYIMARNVEGLRIFCVDTTSFLDPNRKKLTKSRKNLLNNTGNWAADASASHIILKYEDIYFDSHGFIGVDDNNEIAVCNHIPAILGRKVTSEYTKAEIACAVLEGNWNSVFFESMNCCSDDVIHVMNSVEQHLNQAMLSVKRSLF